MNGLMDIGVGLAYAVLGLIVVFIAKLVRGVVTRVRLDVEMTEKDNPAVGVAVTGHLAAVVAIFIGASIGPDPITEPTLAEIGMSMLEVLAWSLGGIVCLHIGEIVLDRVVLRDFSLKNELVEDRNVGSGAVVFGGCVATGLVVAGAVNGEGGGVDTALAFFAAGQLALILFCTLYKMTAGYKLHAEIESDNVAAGVAFGLSMVALGVLLLRATAGDFTGWADNFLNFAYYAVGGTILLVILRRVVDIVLLPGASLAKEIAQDRNVTAAWVEGMAAISLATILFFTI
jgi:uncharacterized membrane protein YjfL (UPF0719 family)